MKQALLILALTACSGMHAAEMKVQISWGHQQAPKRSAYYIQLSPATKGVEVRDITAHGFKAGEGLKDGAWHSSGTGDVVGLRFTLAYPDEPDQQLQNLQIIWADLIANSDADTARRLGQDPAFHPNAPKLTVFTDAEGESGFTISTDQLRQQQAIWIPSLDIYLTAGESPISFDEHMRQLSAWVGKRILDRVHAEPEATYELYKSRWQDMGSPFYVHPRQPAPGHIVGLTWDSAIAKFGIDRGAGVRNDYGNPDHFQFWFDFGSLAHGILDSWKGQMLKDGLPVISTVFMKDRTRYEVEQFAYPLNGPPAERRGDIAMVLMQRVKVTDLQGVARTVPITISERRLFPAYLNTSFTADTSRGRILFRDSAHRQVLLGVEGIEKDVEWAGVLDDQKDQKRLNATVNVDLPANGSREFIVKLPSPMVRPEDAATFAAINYDAARTATLNFWSGFVEGGPCSKCPRKL